ncbi:MAG: DUF998 domain-containing protein [Promethearchaeia archaeon]
MILKENIFFEKAWGGILGIISVIIGVLGMCISYSAIPGYNMLDNMVSDLGVGPLGLFFNIGFILSGIIAIPYYLNLSYIFQQEGMNHRLILGSIIFSLVSSITYSFVGIFPAIQSKPLIYLAHGTFASITVMCGAGYLLLFGYMMYTSERFKKGHAMYSMFVFVFYIMLLFTWIPIIEWTATLSILFWNFFNSLYLLILNKKNKIKKKSKQ